MSSNRVEAAPSDLVVVVAKTQTQKSGTDQVIAKVHSKEVAPVSNNPVVPYRPVDFVDVPTGPPVMPVVDPTNFDHFKNHVKSKLCYNAAILDKAVVTKRTPRMAFQIDIWSLMEQRSMEQRVKPYRGETVSGRKLGNAFDWKGPQFDPSSTIVEGTRTKSFPLEQTQQKIKCETCDADGKQLCALCHGRGQLQKNNNISQCTRCTGRGYTSCSRCGGTAYLLVYDQLNIKWNTEHSTRFYQDTFLPEKTIREIPNKPTFYDADADWINDIFLTSYGDLYRVIAEKSPVRFEKGIQQQYQDFHFIKLKESMVIRRLRILIRYVDILETEYQLEGFTNNTKRHKGTNTFSYLQYNQNDKGQPFIYEDDYPKNSCGCLGPKSGCRCGCSIS